MIRRPPRSTPDRSSAASYVSEGQLLGVMVAVIVALVNFIKTNDVQFTPDGPGNTPIVLSELALHNTPQDCWVVLHGDIYDLSNYASRHPGGAAS